MPAAETERAGRRLMEVLDSGDWSRADEFIATDIVMFHPSSPDPIRGREAVQGFLSLFRAGFPDLRLVIQDLAVGDDKVAIKWRAHGTHTADLFGIPPTGKTMDIMGISFLKVAGGKVVEDTVVEDTLGMFRQIGITPPMS